MSVPVRFGTYEFFRIVLPGFFLTGLLCVFAYFFLPTRQLLIDFSQLSIFPFGVLAVGIFIGLLLYAYDYPRRTSFYTQILAPEMPSMYLKKILCDKCSKSSKACKNKINNQKDARNTYFYILNNLFDANSRQRVFYFGSIYCAFGDIRAISGFFAIPIILSSIFGYFWPNGLPYMDTILRLIFGSVLFVIWLFLHPEFFCKETLSKGDRYMRYILDFQRKYLDLEIDEIKKKLCKQVILH